MRKYYLLVSVVFCGLLALVFYLAIQSKSQPIPLIIPDSANDISESVSSVSPSLSPKSPPLSSIEDLFSQVENKSIKPNTTSAITILATGDVLTARSVNARTVKDQHFTWPFEKTAQELQRADITFINLETPLVSNCPPKVTGMIFCGDLRNSEGLKYAGVDVVNLANNHAGNYQHEGVEESVVHLEQNGFLVSGVKGPVYTKVKDQKIAFLGYNEVDIQPGVALADTNKIKTEIKEAKANADLVIVQFHWGQEYTYTPTSNQKRLARLAIDEGADLIIGNHPHWIQPLEFYKGKLITYSHGNFVFDQMWSRETRVGYVGKYTFEDGQLVHVNILPNLIVDYGQPHWLEGAEKEAVINTLKQESIKIKTNDQPQP